jgi:TRAP-type C4-dicarboxylate transport system permease small subunit
MSLAAPRSSRPIHGHLLLGLGARGRMEDNHVNIDLVPNMFKGRGRIIFSIWAELIEVLTMSFFTKLAWDYTAHMIEEGTVTGGLAIPMWIFYAFIIFGSVTCALFGLINLIRNIWRIIKWSQH